MRQKILALTAALALLLGLAPSALAAEELQVGPNASKVYVDGREVAFDAYTIHDNNYFKLRDLAYVLSGTAKQFDVTWDSGKGLVNLLSGRPYTPAGGELAAGTAGLQRAVPSSNPMNLDGRSVRLTAYSINGNNYVKLRDVGALLNFAVEWDGAISIDTTRGYHHSDEAKAAATAMLTRLDELSGSEWGLLQARLLDLNGDGLRELFVLTGMGGTLYDWSDGALRETHAGAYAGGSLTWYLCRDAATGELGIEYDSGGGGGFAGGEHWYIYLSHQTYVRGIGIFDDFDPEGETQWVYKVDEQEATQAQYEAAMARNIRLEALGGDIYDEETYEYAVPNELTQTRAALYAVLAQ